MSRSKEIERVERRDVTHDRETHDHGYAHRIALSPGYIATRQADMIEGLLPLPPSAITHRVPREPLLPRLAAAAADALIEYKSLLATPLIAAAVTGAASLAHYSTYRAAVAAAGLGLSAASLIVTAVASLMHINNETTPHHVGTQRAGHAGRIIAVAFGAFGILLDVGIAALAGPFSGASWATGMLAWLGIAAPWAMWISDGRADAYAAETHRIGAVATLAAASRTVTGQASTHTPPPDGSSVHPIGRIVVWALADIGVAGAVVDGMPTVLDADRWTVTVTHPGTSARRVIAKVDDLAAKIPVIPGGLRITQGEQSHQTVWTVNNVPLRRLEPPGAHPVIDAPEVSIWDPMDLGLDDEGNPIRVVLAGTPGIFIAGNPRMGKSTVQAAIVCTVVRAKDCRLWTIDASGRELVIFDEIAERRAGADIDDAIRLLKELQQEITDRGAILKEHRATELTRELAEKIGLDCIGLVIDELSYFTNHDNSKKRTEFNTRLRDVESRGGAVGVFGVPATQKPEAEVVPSAIRDMITLKLALMCETADQVDTILGKGMHKSLPAHELLVSDKGVGYIKGVPERDPCRIRTHQITPEQRYAIVDQYAPHHTPTPPRGPGGRPADVEDGDGWGDSRWGHLRPVRVPLYPDGKEVEEHYVSLWQALDRFPDGFTYRQVGELGILEGRSGVQRPLDSWRRLGYLAQAAALAGPSGHLTYVWRKVTPEEWRALNGEAVG